MGSLDLIHYYWSLEATVYRHSYFGNLGGMSQGGSWLGCCGDLEKVRKKIKKDQVKGQKSSRKWRQDHSKIKKVVRQS
jgi:hypothetical protein